MAWLSNRMKEWNKKKNQTLPYRSLLLETFLNVLNSSRTVVKSAQLNSAKLNFVDSIKCSRGSSAAEGAAAVGEVLETDASESPTSASLSHSQPLISFPSDCFSNHDFYSKCCAIIFTLCKICRRKKKHFISFSHMAAFLLLSITFSSWVCLMM